MAAPKTPDEFNTLMRGFAKTVSPYPLSIRSTQSYVEEVFIEVGQIGKMTLY